MLHDAVAYHRCVFIAGLPGAGKSLLVQQAAVLAGELDRRVHLLQWDVARLAYERPEILARYPEVGGVTHPAIRVAASRWAREAAQRWHREHPDPAHLLLGETPLVGERLMELARPRDDAVEPLLASDATLFLVPVPSRAVREAIESARARETDAPVHERDAASAPPHLVRWQWEDLERVGAELGLSGPVPLGTYDPELYARVYQRLLRHRRSLVVPITRVLAVEGPVHELPPGATEIVPTPSEVAAGIAAQMARSDQEIAGEAARWYEV